MTAVGQLANLLRAQIVDKQVHPLVLVAVGEEVDLLVGPHRDDVLARVVEVVAGQPYGDFLQKRILAPLGMRDTGFAVAEADWDRVACR